ncbi:stealth family protein [Weissella viridescens]|uniref:stealth family protein n=1 Tax=Weissella viridescens TaxID=1629 RepID=UPI004056DCC2
MDFPIDFVVTWVDGGDAKWVAKRNKFKAKDEEMNSEARFRDYGIFKYWFRSVQKNAPWVNKIFLITDHQVPEWLKLSDKIELINHEDYIDEKYLPTFNSNVIEMNINKIEGLSEHFVLFNDDMFMLNKLQPSDLFDSDGLSKDCYIGNVIQPTDQFSHIFVQNLSLINQKFNKRASIKHNFKKYFNLRYGKLLLLNLYVLPFPAFTRFYDPHLPIPYRKTDIDRMWDYFGISIQEMQGNKFRQTDDYSIWLARYIRLVEGYFTPVRQKGRGGYLKISDTEDVLRRLNSKDLFVAVNDDDDLDEEQFNAVKQKVGQLFEQKWTEKSNYEK